MSAVIAVLPAAVSYSLNQFNTSRWKFLCSMSDKYGLRQPLSDWLTEVTISSKNCLKMGRSGTVATADNIQVPP